MAVKAIRTGKPLKKSTSKGKAKKTALKKRIKKTKNGLLSAIQKKSKGLGELDYTFLLITAVLTIIGLVMLLSASTPAANIKFGKSYYFFIRQFIFTALGIALMYAISFVDYHTYKKYANMAAQTVRKVIK